LLFKEAKESWKFIEKLQTASLVQAKLLPAQIMENSNNKILRYLLLL